jgi:ubiquinone biosynthesis protein
MVSPVKTAVQDIRRLREIAGVLTRHGFDAFARSAGLERFVGDGDEEDEPEKLPEVEQPRELLPEDEEDTDVAVRFRHVLEDLGPTFVKLGQVLSTRPDILPPAFMDELQSLQDDVPPMDFEKVRQQVEENLEGELGELFDNFQEEPLAAASIGQVHRARTTDGQEVVVKVQRLGIQDKIQSDLDILYYLARFLEATIEEVELYTPTAIVEEFEEAILSELDFEQEATNIETFGANFEDEPRVDVPDVFRELTTEKILTLEYIDAVKLRNIEGGTPRAERVLDTLLDAMVEMVLYDGFFHGDPHPGNMLVGDDDTLIFIDFGLVGSLSPHQQNDLIDLILTILTGDEDGIARTVLRMGYPVGRVNLRKFKSDIVELRDRYLFSSLSEVNVSEFVQETMDAAQRHQIRLNPDYARLTKAATTIEGIMRRLKPDMDIMKKGMPYARELAMHRFSAKNVMKGVMNSAMGFSGFVQQVPQQIDQVMMDLESGNLEISVTNESLDELGDSLNTLGTRLFLGIMSASLAICATLLLRQFQYQIYGVSVPLVAGLLLVVTATLFFWWALSWHVFGGSGSGKVRLTPLLRLFRRD